MKHICSLLTTALLGVSPAAYAQDTQDKEQTHFDVGGTVLVRPAYVGSNQTKTNIFPYLGFQNLYGVDAFGPSLTASVFDIGTGKGPGKWSLTGGPRVSFDFGRDSSDSPTLDKLEDIDTSVIVGGYVRSTLSIIGFDISAGQDVIGGHDGFVADLSVGTRYPGNGWYIQPIVTLSWADQNYTQTVYGISEQDALNSALGAFETSSGFHQASATLLSGFELNENWNVTALVSYRQALGDYTESPIIQAEDGSASGLFTTLSLSRRFSF